MFYVKYAHCCQPALWQNGISATHKNSIAISLNFVYPYMITTLDGLYNKTDLPVSTYCSIYTIVWLKFDSWQIRYRYLINTCTYIHIILRKATFHACTARHNFHHHIRIRQPLVMKVAKAAFGVACFCVLSVVRKCSGDPLNGSISTAQAASQLYMNHHTIGWWGCAWI